MDDSVWTINICLGDEFEGNATYFFYEGLEKKECKIDITH